MTKTKTDVKALNEPAETFLCPLKANKYALQFLQLRVRDPSGDKVFLE